LVDIQGKDLSTPHTPQTVDPAVTREKYDAELREYKAREGDHQRRGWWMLEAKYPTVFVVFATPQLKPPAVICGVLIDFTNYDLEAPSVVLVDPFTRVPYAFRELPTALVRRQVVNLPPGFAPVGAEMVQGVPLMQAHQPDDIPFLCVPGVREYHAHPAHSGDSWLIHRGRGEGKLYSILHTIYQYGIRPINDFTFGIRVVGFQQGEPPA
jgi:Predicted metal binding domain